MNEEFIDYYSKLSFKERFRLHRLCAHKKKYYKLMNKFETVDQSIDVLEDLDFEE